MVENARGPQQPGHTVDAVKLQCQARELELLPPHSVLRSQRMLNTWQPSKASLASCTEWGGNSLLSGKKPQPRANPLARFIKEMAETEQIFPFCIEMTHEIVYSKSYILHRERWRTWEWGGHHSLSLFWGSPLPPSSPLCVHSHTGTSIPNPKMPRMVVSMF